MSHYVAVSQLPAEGEQLQAARFSKYQFLLIAAGLALLYSTSVGDDGVTVFWRQVIFLGAGLVGFFLLSFFFGCFVSVSVFVFDELVLLFLFCYLLLIICI